MFHQSEIQLIKHMHVSSKVYYNNYQNLLIVLPSICAGASIQFNLIILYLWIVC